MRNPNTYKIFVDIDDTIAKNPRYDSKDYSLAEPIKNNIDKINRLYDMNYHITYYTARGAISGRDWRKVTEEQLKRWGAKYDDLRMDKPAFDILIDDKVMNTTDFNLMSMSDLQRAVLGA